MVQVTTAEEPSDASAKLTGATVDAFARLITCTGATGPVQVIRQACTVQYLPADPSARSPTGARVVAWVSQTTSLSLMSSVRER